MLFTAMAMVLAVLVGTVLMHRLQIESVQSVHQGLQAWQPVLTGVRVAVIVLVTLGWRRAVAMLAHAGMLDPARAGWLTVFRARIVLWLVGLELVLGQGALVWIVQLAMRMAP